MDFDKSDFSIVDHTADLGIRVRGTNLKDLFERAAISMIQIMIRGNPGKKTNTVKLSVPGEDLADLMVRWLGEILYVFEGEGEVVTTVKIDSISPTHLDATLKTVPFDPNLHEVLCEIKAVTYHQIQVAQKDDHWETTVIFDL